MHAQSLLQVGKAKLLCRLRHFVDEWVGIINVFVILELSLPILRVKSSVIEQAGVVRLL
jgi:hypothetical protein